MTTTWYCVMDCETGGILMEGTSAAMAAAKWDPGTVLGRGKHRMDARSKAKAMAEKLSGNHHREDTKRGRTLRKAGGGDSIGHSRQAAGPAE